MVLPPGAYTKRPLQILKKSTTGLSASSAIVRIGRPHLCHPNRPAFATFAVRFAKESTQPGSQKGPGCTSFQRQRRCLPPLPSSKLAVWPLSKFALKGKTIVYLPVFAFCHVLRSSLCQRARFALFSTFKVRPSRFDLQGSTFKVRPSRFDLQRSCRQTLSVRNLSHWFDTQPPANRQNRHRQTSFIYKTSRVNPALLGYKKI